jgi:hypothetical protein
LSILITLILRLFSPAWRQGYFKYILVFLSHNVLAVYDVFLRPIRKNAKHFFGRKKMWRSNTPQRAQARLVYCVARAAEGGEAYTDLLGEVQPIFHYFIF